MNTNATHAHCIDAETLAAWADGGLSTVDAERVELHLSNCERCQEVLAAFVRSEPAAAVVLPFWSRRPVRWGAATLAAAAAVTLMVWTPRPSPLLKQDSVVARNEAGASAPSRPAVDERVDDLKKATTAEEAVREKVLPPPTVLAAPPPVPASPPPPPAAVLGGVAAGRAVAAEPTLELRDMAKRETDELAVVEIMAPDSATLAGRRLNSAQASAARAGGAGRGGGSVVPVRWRILQGVRVERSVDNGVTWSPVTLTAATTQLRERERFALAQPEFVLTGGAAASQTVCWLVGQNGTVFVAKDGVTFEQVTSPDPAAIKSVEAVDALHATVTTVDGRTFSSSDGGVTWTKT